MHKLNIFVCKNYFPEFEHIIEKMCFNDVVLKIYPSMCENKSLINATSELMQSCCDQNDDALIFCGTQCDIKKMIPESGVFKIISSQYCFPHLANEFLMEYIIEKGGYVISSGWLESWRENIHNAGFDQITAQNFYREFCKELVFFDPCLNQNFEAELKALALFLNLPYKIIPIDLEYLQVLIKGAVLEWKLQKNIDQNEEMLSEYRSQCAEYSAILNLMGKLSVYSNRADTIEKIKEIFIAVIGAQKFEYFDIENEEVLSQDTKLLYSDAGKTYIYFKEENKFCIKIDHNDMTYGIIEVGDFLFPQYSSKYLNFAIEIAKISGLVFSNIAQYEKLTKSEKDLQYLSFHDSLTGLYNRTYLNEILKLKKKDSFITVFMFDIDKLKYVNDHFGHLEGDKYICNIAELLKNSFREGDEIARIGGDEFVAILHHCDVFMAQMLKIHIIDEIRKFNDNDFLEYPLSVSIGYAVSESKEDTIEILMQKADALMYKNKLKSRNSNLN